MTQHKTDTLTEIINKKLIQKLVSARSDKWKRDRSFAAEFL